ncbi:MAG: hypothetical protein ACHREM_28955, partial [Polyangiales bacterium]
VAQVSSELRFLVVRRSLPRAWIATLVGACAALFALRLAALFVPSSNGFASAEVTIGWGLALAGAIAGGLAARRVNSAIGVALVAAGILVAALSSPSLSRLVFAHAHNVITIAVWAWVFRRRLRYAVPTLLAIAIGIGFFASGAALAHARLDGPFARRFVDEAIFGWPRGLLSQRTALGVGLAYVFLQAIHYGVWLGWVPQEDVRAEGTITFRMSARAIMRDLGAPGVAVTLIAAALVLGGSLFDVHRTRALYLSLATFHGYLEVSVLAFFLARGRRSS